MIFDSAVQRQKREREKREKTERKKIRITNTTEKKENKREKERKTKNACSLTFEIFSIYLMNLYDQTIKVPNQQVHSFEKNLKGIKNNNNISIIVISYLLFTVVDIWL